MEFTEFEQKVLDAVFGSRDYDVLLDEEFIGKLRQIMPPTRTPNERAFLDELREKGKWSESNDEYTGIAIGDYTFINQSDFTTQLKELVNDTKTKAD